MPTRLFLVHGMGEFDATWAAKTETQIDALYATYETLAAVARKDRFTIHPVVYDDVLRDLVKRWQTDANAISNLAIGATPKLVETLVGWLKTAGTGFAWSHAADVLLYRLFSDVREAVVVRIAKQIFDVVNADLDAFGECHWGVIAHSLGTIGAHDALQALWTSTLPDGSDTGFAPKDVKADFVAMIANVSRLLETDVDVLESAVKPGKASALDRGCLNFLTARHALDPFTIPRMFDPVDWPDPETVAQRRYQSIRVTHIHDRNIHGLSHYLVNPAVHIPLFRLLARLTSVISAAEEKQAVKDFPTFGSLGAAKGVQERQRLESIQPSMSDEWKQLRAIWDAFFGD